MQRNLIAVLSLLMLTVLLGFFLGDLSWPVTHHMTGTLDVLETGTSAGISKVGDFELEWNNETGGQLTIRNMEGKVLWQTLPGEPFIFAVEGKETVTESWGIELSERSSEQGLMW